MWWGLVGAYLWLSLVTGRWIEMGLLFLLAVTVILWMTGREIERSGGR